MRLGLASHLRNSHPVWVDMEMGWVSGAGVQESVWEDVHVVRVVFLFSWTHKLLVQLGCMSSREANVLSTLH